MCNDSKLSVNIFIILTFYALVVYSARTMSRFLFNSLYVNSLYFFIVCVIRFVNQSDNHKMSSRKNTIVIKIWFQFGKKLVAVQNGQFHFTYIKCAHIVISNRVCPPFCFPLFIHLYQLNGEVYRLCLEDINSDVIHIKWTSEKHSQPKKERQREKIIKRYLGIHDIQLKIKFHSFFSRQKATKIQH